MDPQELAVLSFPGPDRSIRLADLRRGKAVSRRYRNRRIGEFLKELDLTEGRATGVPKILRAMRANGSPAPKFESDDDRTSFLIRQPVHPEARVGAIPEVTGQVTEEVGRLVLALRMQKSRKELQQSLQLKGSANFEERYLKPALEAGMIEPTIPDEPNSRLQKYRLTPRGRAWMVSNSRL